MQYNRDEAGNLTPLPKKNIDTGMGLKGFPLSYRECALTLRQTFSLPIITKACEIGGVTYGEDKKKDMAVKAISDHIRASAFMIADGILPANDGGGYVLRRLIRRSLRYGRLLGIDRPFLIDLLPVVRESIGDEYSELIEQSSAIEQVLSLEEERFLKTSLRAASCLNLKWPKLKRTEAKLSRRGGLCPL